MIPAHRILPGVVTEIIRKAPLSPEKVTFAWRAAVGPASARVTTVQLTDNGALAVSALDPHWLTEVQRSSRLILARLESTLGPEVVKEIAIDHGSGRGRSRPRNQGKRPQP